MKTLKLRPNLIKIVSNVSRFKPALYLIRVLADLSRGSNSLNSDSGLVYSRLKEVFCLIVVDKIGKTKIGKDLELKLQCFDSNKER